MSILKDLQSKKRNKDTAKVGWKYIVSKVVSKEVQVIQNSGFSEFLIDNVLIALVFNKRIVFQGYFSQYFTIKEASFLEKEIFGVEKSTNYNKGSNNNGHKFERTVAFALKELGFSVKGIKCSNEFPDVVDSVKDVLKELNKEPLVKVKDIKNAESISGDFLGKSVSISCKYNNEVLKHPTLMKVFSIALGVDRESFVNSFDVFKTDKIYTKKFARKEFGKDSEFAKILVQELQNRLVKENETIQTKNVTDLYNFLIGKDRPLLLSMKPDNSILVKNMKDLKEPTSYEWIFSDNKIIVKFDNGVKLSHRFKSAISSKTQTTLSKVYKEEWKLI